MDCSISGVIIRPLKKHDDSRGWLCEMFRLDELAEEFHPAMSYVSMTHPGVVRGPHEHVDQADYFCFIGPSTFRLYLWDNRQDSATHGEKQRVDTGEDNPLAVMVPKGVVHAYKNIGATAGIVYNAPNRLYAGHNRQEPVDEIRHEDKAGSPFQLWD